MMRMLGAALGALVGTLLVPSALVLAQEERDHWTVEFYETPTGERLEVGGLDFLPDGTLVLCTRRGQVWLVRDPLAEDVKSARFELFAEGLQEGLGLRVLDGVIHVVQRGELSRLLDTDGDGRCDRIETITNAWGLSENYHEFGYGLPVDKQGNFYVSLNVAFLSPKWWHGKSNVPWRGWVLKISPEGELSPYAAGFRSPNGLGISPDDEVFLTDNQGDWMPVCPIVHVEEGKFFSHPASLRWTEEYGDGDTEPDDIQPVDTKRSPAAIWIPYEWSRSTGSLVWDQTGGKFGPFEGQAIVAELTNGMLLRAHFEKVRGVTQGAIWPLRHKVGSANRVRFAPDGTMMVGLTNRGWGGEKPGDGLARVRFTGKTPFEVATVNVLDTGFRLTFTEPLADGVEFGPENVEVEQYDYDWWWEYGSPQRHFAKRTIFGVDLEGDRRSATIGVQGLEAGMMARVTIRGIEGASGGALLHDTFHYTINRLPSGSDDPPLVAKVVQPPPPKEQQEEGWLYLSWGAPDHDWNGEGWTLANAELEGEDHSSFQLSEGDGAYVPEAAAETARLMSRWSFEDTETSLQFKLAEGAGGTLWLQGRYGLELLDETDLAKGGEPSSGRLAGGSGFAGKAPDRKAVRRAGDWNRLDVRFRAPRFDESGAKTEKARILRVLMNNQLLHQDVEVDGPSDGAPLDSEAKVGPLVLQGGEAGFALSSVRVRKIQEGEKKNEPGWERIFDGKTLDGWKISDNGAWAVENGAIVGRGARSHLFSPRDDYTDFEFRAKVKINDKGNSGMYFRVQYGPGWPAGYEAQVNSTFSDPQKTGSLYTLAPIRTTLIPANVWFTQHVICRNEEGGVRIRIFVNDLEVVNHLDTERKHAVGHVAFQQHHQGSEVRYQNVEVRELGQEDGETPRGAVLMKRYAPFRLNADLSKLAAHEKAMLKPLIEAAREMETVFWKMAYGDRDELLGSLADDDLRRYAAINYGPWDRLNGNEPFLPGYGPKPKGARFYPADATQAEIEAAAEKDEAILGLTTIVERGGENGLRAVSYHERFAEEFGRAATKLEEAASLAQDEGLKRYLEMRAEALRTDTYRPSDLAWMDMKSNGLDIVIGPIETYEDQLFGAKAAAEAYVLVKDREWSQRLAHYALLLPELQRSLPVPEEYKQETPGTDSDLGAYDVVYYAGDCNAGSKTIAINLPNDEHVQLQKGTRRLQLKNAMQAKFDKVLSPIVGVLIDPEQREHVKFPAFFGNTMFHEIAHGLGIKNTLEGKGTVRGALREHSSALEECKADVLGLHLVTELFRRGELTDGRLEDHYVTFLAGIFRSSRFGAASAHGRANMIAFSVFEELGAFQRNEERGTYRVDFEKMQAAVAELARRLLVVQGNGDYEGAARMLETQGVMGDALAADLARLADEGIPVDIYFEQGLEVLGLDR